MPKVKEFFARLLWQRQAQVAKPAMCPEPAARTQQKLFDSGECDHSHSSAAVIGNELGNAAESDSTSLGDDLPMIGKATQLSDVPASSDASASKATDCSDTGIVVTEQLQPISADQPSLFKPVEHGGLASYEPPAEAPIIGTARGLDYAREFAELLVSHMARTGCPARWRGDHLIDYAGRVCAPAIGLEMPIERNLLSELKKISGVQVQPNTHVYENGVRLGKRTIYNLPI